MAVHKTFLSVAPLRILASAAKIWFSHDAFRNAGALAFYTLFSLAPLMIILVAIVGVVYGDEAARGQVAARLVEMFGEKTANAVQEAVRQSRPDDAGLLPTVAGIVTLLFGATAVFAQMQGSLNQLWDVQAKPARSSVLTFLTVRLLSLGMVLIIGFLLLISFAVSVILSGILEYAEHWVPVPATVTVVVDGLLSVGIATLMFALLFKVLPDIRLLWIDVWRGAFVTAILFVMGQYGISYYLTHVAPTTTFGAAWSLVLVLFWVYYSSLILFFGTALTRALIAKSDHELVPKNTAVRVKKVVVEE